MTNEQKLKFYASEIETMAKLCQEAENTESTFIKGTILQGCVRDLEAIEKGLKNLKKEIKAQINK